jgi:hypothetical protein
MPPVRSDVGSSSTARRKRLADRIESLGIIAMAPCPQCVASKTVCVIHQCSTKCASCVRKNIRCDGMFSDAEFDSLEATKEEIFLKKMEARVRLTKLAWELLGVQKRLIAAQKEVESLDVKLEKVCRKQNDMLALEARALEELDEITPRRDELVDPGREKPFAIPGEPIAIMSELDFNIEDPEILAILNDVGGTPGSVPG